jgi:hypothetical protein
MKNCPIIRQPMNIITDIKITLGVEDILRGQGVDPQTVYLGKPTLLSAAKRALTEGQNLLHPVALIQEIEIQGFHHECIILGDGASLTGPLVTRHLAGAQRLVAAVSTIGPELETEVTHLLNVDPLYALALDGLGNAAVETLAQQVCAGIGKKIQAEGLQVSTPLSPGSPDWPVEVGQPQIFALLHPAQAGISLTSGGMMVPKKTISFVVGLGHEMAQSDLCAVCSLKGTCRYGHA